MPEVDEFGIPIKATGADEFGIAVKPPSQQVDEFGIPFKKKEEPFGVEFSQDTGEPTPLALAPVTTITEPQEKPIKIEHAVSASQSSLNSLKNIVTSIKGTVPRLAIASAEIYEGVLGDEQAKEFYAFTGMDIDARKKEARDALDELDKQILPTRGITESIKTGSIPGLAAGIIDATTAIVSTAVPGILSGSATLYTDMIGSSINDYNKAKAESLGITVDELYEKNAEDFVTPATIGALGGALERVGLKGVSKAITKKLKGSVLKKTATMLNEFNREGMTEFVQLGLETYNTSLGGGKGQSESVTDAVDMMFSEQGLEVYLMGVAGSGGASTIGRGIRAPFKKKEDIAKLQTLDPLDEKEIDKIIKQESFEGKIIPGEEEQAKEDLIKDIEAAKKMEGGKIPEGKEGDVHDLVKEKSRITDIQKEVDKIVSETLAEDLEEVDNKLREALGLEEKITTLEKLKIKEDVEKVGKKVKAPSKEAKPVEGEDIEKLIPEKEAKEDKIPTQEIETLAIKIKQAKDPIEFTAEEQQLQTNYPKELETAISKIEPEIKEPVVEKAVEEIKEPEKIKPPVEVTSEAPATTEQITKDIDDLKIGKISVKNAPDIRSKLKRSRIPFAERIALEKRLGEVEAIRVEKLQDPKEKATLKKIQVGLEKAANSLEDVKIKPDKLFALPPGVNLAPAVWNGAISAMQVSLKAGAKLADAIDTAIEYIKSKIGVKEFGEVEFRKIIDKNINKPKEVPLAETVPDNEKVQRGFQKRSLEVADETPSQKQVKKVVENNRLYYERMNINNEMSEAAEKISNAGGFDARYNILIKPSESISDLAPKQAQRQLAMDYYGGLLDKALKAKDNTKAREYDDKINTLQDITSTEATGAGQASAVLAWWKFRSPEGITFMFKRKLKDHNDTLLDRKKGVKKGFDKILEIANGEESIASKKKKIMASLKRISASSKERLGISPKEKSKTKSLTDQIIDMAETGILTDQKLKDLVAEKIGLAKALSSEQAAKLKELAENVRKYKGDEFLGREATIDLLKYMDSLYPGSDRLNTFISLYYSSILSGFSTHVLNIFSAGSNMIAHPIVNTANIALWYRAAKQGLKEKSWETFKAYSPFNDLVYMASAAAQGAVKGKAEFNAIFEEGGYDNKFMEQVASKGFRKISPLEREKYGKDAFVPFRIKLPKGKSIDVNPYNYAKYVGRALAAEDALMTRANSDMFMSELIRDKYLNEGLRGKRLKKAVSDEIFARNIDKEAIQKQVNKDVIKFEEDTGIKLSEAKKKIMLQQRIDEELDKDLKESADELARTNVFTGERGGVIANAARSVAFGINKSVGRAVLIKPFIPFTRVVGNVAEYMMDATPFYGIMRAHGLSGTALYNWSTGQDIKTAQLGEVGSRQYYEQMGRAFLGTTSFIALAAYFMTGDEDDEDKLIEISGGYEEDSFKKRGRERVMPKYSIRIGGEDGFVFNYINVPSLAIPLALIGNYRDAVRLGMKDDDLSERLTAALLNTSVMFKDISFLGGIQKFIELSNDVFDAASKGTAAKKLLKGLVKTYFGAATRPLPQNFNIVKQTTKLFDPTSYSQKEIQEIITYDLGIHRFVNNPSIDVLGETVKTYPGESMMPYTHWFGIKGKDKRWRFMAKYNAIPQSIYNKTKTIRGEKRKLTPDEFYKYTKLAGRKYNMALIKYMRKGSEYINKRAQTKVGDKTGVQQDLEIEWNIAKIEAWSVMKLY